MKSLTDIRTQMGVSDPAEDSRARVRQQQADILSALQTGNNVGDKLLATGMMGQVQGFENVRRGLAGLNPAFRSEAEVLDDALKGIDTTTPNGQRQALEIVRRISPGKAMALATEFDARNKAVLDNMPRYQVGSESYANGVRVDNTDQGQIIVRQNGRVIKDPAEAAQLIREGQLADIDLARRKASATKEAELSVAQIQKVSNQIDIASTQIDRFDDAIELLEEGADATLYSTYTPNWLKSKATIEFDLLANQMGLDILSSTTFGALSEKELKLALETGMPRFTSNADALAYMKERKAADEALAKELTFFLDYLQKNEGRFQSRAKMEEAFTKKRKAEEKTRQADPTSNADEKLSTEDALRALQDLELPTGA